MYTTLCIYLSPAPFGLTARRVFSGSGGSGDKLVVTLKVTNPFRKFKGYIIQARQYQDPEGGIGKFNLYNGQRYVPCPGNPEATLTHVSNQELKTRVETVWQAPPNWTGTVQFTASVVMDFRHFWTGIKSQPIKVQANIVNNNNNGGGNRNNNINRNPNVSDIRGAKSILTFLPAGQQMMRIVVVVVVVGMKLNYLRCCGVLVPLMSFSFSFLFFVVGQLKFLTLPLIT